ncbi:MmcQ/YjbR family DNA-binding protein [Enterovibrio norvegicus]|uniref:MmcQ/YjbR family DNA-binding protein n=1 Tax=Enterovibrio norvegicus TaxID=188144 RepID=UPI00352CF49F
MDVETLKQQCLTMKGAREHEEAAPNNVLIYSVGGKKFAYFKTSEPEQWRFSIRVSPERFLELLDQPGVKPARYMHRFHWVTIVDVTVFNEEYLATLIAWSYSKAMSSLSKKAQFELQAQQ